MYNYIFFFEGVVDFCVLSKVVIYKGFLVYFDRKCICLFLSGVICMPGLEIVLLGLDDDRVGPNTTTTTESSTQPPRRGRASTAHGAG